MPACVALDGPMRQETGGVTAATDGEARTATLALVADRAEGATVCPSEVARLLARDGADREGDWRAMMPVVHAAVDELLGQGLVRLSWKGTPLTTRAGPYRIGRPRG